VKALPDGGDTWAVRQFKKRIEEGRRQAGNDLQARVGLILDRDDETNDKWPTVAAILRDLGVDPGSARTAPARSSRAAMASGCGPTT
jgi:hypothetical protein